MADQSYRDVEVFSFFCFNLDLPSFLAGIGLHSSSIVAASLVRYITPLSFSFTSMLRLASLHPPGGTVMCPLHHIDVISIERERMSRRGSLRSRDGSKKRIKKEKNGPEEIGATNLGEFLASSRYFDPFFFVGPSWVIPGTDWPTSYECECYLQKKTL